VDDSAWNCLEQFNLVCPPGGDQPASTDPPALFHFGNSSAATVLRLSPLLKRETKQVLELPHPTLNAHETTRRSKLVIVQLDGSTDIVVLDASNVGLEVSLQQSTGHRCGEWEGVWDFAATSCLAQVTISYGWYLWDQGRTGDKTFGTLDKAELSRVDRGGYCTTWFWEVAR